MQAAEMSPFLDLDGTETIEPFADDFADDIEQLDD
jgi:hypothetical protein